MRRSRVLVHVLWSVAASAAPACGRVGFEPPAVTQDSAPAGTPTAMYAPSLALTSECGQLDPPASALAITNTGTADLVIASAETDGLFGVVDVFPVVIAAGATGALHVTAPIAIIGTDRGGDLKPGQLRFVANDAIGTHAVDLASTVIGANIQMPFPLSSALAFAGTSGACPAAQEIDLANTGNAPATIAISGASGLGGFLLFTGFSGGTLDPQAGTSSFIKPFTSAPCIASDTVVYEITGSVCTSQPLVVALSLSITGSSSCSCQ